MSSLQNKDIRQIIKKKESKRKKKASSFPKLKSIFGGQRNYAPESFGDVKNTVSQPGSNQHQCPWVLTPSPVPWPQGHSSSGYKKCPGPGEWQQATVGGWWVLTGQGHRWRSSWPPQRCPHHCLLPETVRTRSHYCLSQLRLQCHQEMSTVNPRFPYMVPQAQAEFSRAMWFNKVVSITHGDLILECTVPKDWSSP